MLRVAANAHDAVEVLATIGQETIDPVNVREFGAKADGVTDCSQAVRNAITAGAKWLYFPGSTLPYYFSTAPGGSSGIDPGGLIRITGDGIGHTVLQYNEGTDASPRRLFYRNSTFTGYDSTTLRDTLVFEDLEFRGTFNSADTTDRGGVCVFLDGYKEIRFHRVKWKNIATFATDLHFNNRAVWDHCDFEDVARDCARARDTFNVSVTNCIFKRTGDDCVAYHTVDYTGGYSPDNGDPRRHGLVVSNCYFVDAYTAVHCLSGRFVNVHDNVILRGRETPIFIEVSTSSEGTQPAYAISVRNNMIFDRVNASALSAITVTAQDMRGTAASNNTIPSRPTVTTGAFIKPWDWGEVDAGDAADPFPPLTDIDVSNNTIGRSLPTVANYVDWGFGYCGGNDFEYNPAVTNAGLRWFGGINVSGGLRTRISNNTISHTATAIYLGMASVDPNSFSTMISSNIIFDASDRGIVLTNSQQNKGDVLIANNHINCDYYRENANSSANGTYLSGNTAPTGIDLGGTGGAHVTGNLIQNVARVFSATSFSDSLWTDNVLICDPVAIGDSGSNKGIRNVPNPTDGFRYIIAECDPQSATFGQLKNVPLERSNVQPTTGTYLQGQFVKNGNVVLAGGKVTYGWIRLTTGTAHVNGTDWTPLVIANT